MTKVTLGQSGFSSTTKLNPYWWEAAPPLAEEHTTLPASCEVVIAGGGFTGLSAALTLAKRGKNVLVIEAQRCGWGASSRNGGMFGPIYPVFGTGKAFGIKRAAAMVEESRTALAYLKSLVADEGIDCDLRITGRFRGALTPTIYEHMRRGLEAVAKHTECDAFMVPKSEQHKYVHTDYYHGGEFTPSQGGLHPGKYVRGLAEAARRAGAHLITNTPVTGIVGKPGDFIAHTARGAVRAGDVIVATNGYTGTATPAFRKRVMSIRSAMIATERLPAELITKLIPTGVTMGGSQRVVTYYRLSPDGSRILFGGRVLKFGEGNGVPQANAGHLFRKLTDVFPELRSCGLSHYWHGQTGFTFDGLPHLGSMNGIHYAMGYCGTGVLRATWFGRQIALKLLGDEFGACAYDELKFPSKSFYTGKSWFLPIVLAAYESRDRIDSLTAHWRVNRSS